MPRMNIQLTGKCNYNCLHCFNAVDNAPLNSELSFEDMIKLLDEAKDCGVLSFTITGGEPFMHKRFMDIMREIYKRGMTVFELNTNGFFVTREVLKEMKSFGFTPAIKISFDGIGYHDWMRNHQGAEQKALEALKLCVEEGFVCAAQVNVNKENVSSMDKTFDMLDQMGINWAKIIPTTEVPRWIENAKDKTFSVSEYYDFLLEATKTYLTKPRKMELFFWRGIILKPQEKRYSFSNIYDERLYSEDKPLCSCAYQMAAVGANGNMYPCMQMSGILDSLGANLGNVKKDGLKQILTKSKYLDYMNNKVKDKLKYNNECINCKYLKRCRGGCPGLGYVTCGNILNPDRTRCIFFKQGYDQKIVELLHDYKNTTGSPYSC